MGKGSSSQVVAPAEQEPIVTPAVARSIAADTESAQIFRRGVESLADKGYHDDDHRMLTTIPLMTARKAAAGMLQNLTSKGQPWFYLSVPKVLKDGLSRDRKLALEKLTEGARYLMAKSNVYSAIYRLFMHYLVNGFGCMLISAADESTSDIIEAYTLRPGTYALDIGRSGRVERVVRKFAWQPIKILEEPYFQPQQKSFQASERCRQCLMYCIRPR